MDPASAIGLAASIITFIDFAWSLVTDAKELHRSGRGTTKENARIGAIIGELRNCSLELGTGVDSGLSRISTHEKALKDLAGDCCLLSSELEAILAKLKTTKNSRWHSLKTTWAAMRKKGEIATIEARLRDYRSQMTLRLLSLLR